MSNPRRAPATPFLLTCSLAGALGSTGCAHRPPLLLTVPVADSLRATCAGPPTTGVASVGDLAAFSIRQEAALAVCDARREAVLAAVDAHNAAVQSLGKR